ncbi:MAG: hypothetical protein LBJ23_05935 [Tannerella sp.]|jgi:hypothetical protein|nr:hypothetical protein [Tannerella sp.]
MIYLFFLSSCVREYIEKPEEPDFKRTVFVYIGCDNNLRGEADGKVESLKKGWNGKNGYLIIYRDLYGTGAVLEEVYVENGIKKTKEIYAHEDENSASPEVFAGILRDVADMYPADSYGMILFSHASGWLPEATLSSPRSMPTRSLVQDGANWMSMTDFAAAIPDSLFEFILFEACFMAGIEVAYELRNKAEYIVASSAEILSPGFQGVYELSVNALFEPKANLEKFTKDAYEEVDTKSGELRSATLSIIRTDGLNALSDWLRENVSVNKSVDIGDVQHFDRYSYHLFFDFEDYFSRILKDAGKQAELMRMVDNCVIYKAATPEFIPSSLGFKIEKHSGLTTYIRQDEYPYLDARYEELEWFKSIYVIN